MLQSSKRKKFFHQSERSGPGSVSTADPETGGFRIRAYTVPVYFSLAVISCSCTKELYED